MASIADSLPNSKLFRHCPVQIIAGTDKTIYYAHPGVISSCGSSVLGARMDGRWMTHGASEFIDWTDFDEQTVECVLSYFYSNDYAVKCATGVAEDIQPKELDERDQDLTASTSAESPTFSPGILDATSQERPLTPLSRCIAVGLPAETKQTAAGIFTRSLRPDCDEHLGVTALVHAKVYCFAHRFLIPGLESLALQRLTQVLLACDTPSHSFFSTLTDAIRLVYGSTPNATQAVDPARQLLSQYVALKYTTLSDESLNTLMVDGGDFMIDVLRKLARRISMTGRSTRSLEEQVDEFQLKINKLESENERQLELLNRANAEIGEWENWNRGISGKYKKVRRNVPPRSVDAAHEPLDDAAPAAFE